jgi:D-alanine-D-alanine ligase
MGGPSSEHEVSMQGGQNVVAALPPTVFEVRPVVIEKDGVWRMPRKGWTVPPNGDASATGEPIFDAHAHEGWRTYEGAWEGLVALRSWGVDVAIPVLHGRFGEDGTIQACLTAAGIPFVGSDAAASALAFDKVRAKQLFRFHDVDTPDFEVLSGEELRTGRRARIDSWIERHGLPVVLKNPRGGSTLEVRLAADAGEALSAFEELAAGADRLMLEEHVAGRELTVGVVEGRDGPRALPVVEIRPRTGQFFDYQQKYAADGAEEICPADLPPALAARVQAVGLKVHRELGLRGLSRTDLILTEDGRLRVLEVNTLPGMTARGLVPLAASKDGVSFPALLETLIRSARLPTG